MTEELTFKELVGPAPKACALCPWRLSNQGTPHPHKFYSAANIKRLWTGLRTGDAAGMTCHPTDPRMAEHEGYEATAEREVTRECTGALVLIHREVLRFQAIAEVAGACAPRGEALARYRESTKGRGLTRGALADWAWRMLVRLPGGRDFNVTREAINDPDIGTALLPVWDSAQLAEVS